MTRTRSRRLVAVMAAASVALLAVGCGDDDGDAGDSDGAGVVHSFVPLDAGGPNTKAALEQGDIDVAVLFSSDGAIAANGWVTLEDDMALQPVDNFVPAVRTEALTDEMAEVLDAVSAALTVEAMQEMVAAVSIDAENPEDVAAEFLAGVTVPDVAVTGDVTVGSANFAESEITAELYSQALAAAGAGVSEQFQFGARETYIPALEQGEIDLIPEFVGSLSFFLDESAEITSDLDSSLEVARGLAEARGITLLEPAEADSVNTFVVTQATADEHGLASVSDWADVEEELVLGGPPECPERPLCLIGLQDVYGIDFDL